MVDALVSSLVTVANGVQNSPTVTLSGAFSATVFPKDGAAPAVLAISPTAATGLTVQQGGSLVLRLDAMAPWRPTSHSMAINVTAFGGLSTNASTLAFNSTAFLEVSAAATMSPGPYLLRFTQVLGSVLPARRWIHVVSRAQSIDQSVD
jgi:hypothetical protein